LGLQLPVYAISIKAECSHLLDQWLDAGIFSLYDRHTELARQSLNRKIGALRFGVEAALRARLRRSGPRMDTGKLRDLETDLRTATGKIAQARTESIDKTDDLRVCSDELIRTAANHLVEAWASGAGARSQDHVRSMLEQAAAERAALVPSAIQEAARNAGSVLAKVAVALELDNRPEPDELLEVLKNMPRVDLGNLEIAIAPSTAASLLGSRFARARLERRIRSQAGDQLADAIGIYARVLQSWVRKTFTELQEQFDSYADAYRAQLDRLTGNQAGLEDERSLREDLAALAAAAPEDAALPRELASNV